MNNTTLSSPQSETASSNVAPAFVCDCDEWARSACQGKPFFREHEGKSYCVLHYPDKDKLEAFRVALKRKLDAQDFDFRGVWFPEAVDFRKFEFSAKADFYRATFSGDAVFSNATFSAEADFRSTFSAKANFFSAKFSAGADFCEATKFSAEAEFSFAIFISGDADFSEATFSAKADFSSATFISAKADFSKATFSAEADFSGTTFCAEVDFSEATFKSYVRFTGSSYVGVAERKDPRSFGEAPRLNFQFAPIEKPERVSFHTLDLKPHWFINCDCRKFEFTDCDWNHNLKLELEGTIKAKISAPHRLLAITFRQLADNAEANHRYHEASNFRYNAFEARRIEKFRGFVPWRLDWWYWLASGYGERVGRAFVVFVALFALFAFGYGLVGFDQSGKGTTANVTQGAAIQPDTVGKPLDLRDAFIYSLSVTILQKPEPKPLTRTAKLLVNLETILGPAQAALLALAMRRRFMR